MRNLLILSSALVLLGIGSAAADNTHVSERNSAPRHQVQTSDYSQGNVDRSAVTSSITRGKAGFSAAQGFGTSDQSDLPAPRFQIAR